MGKKIHQGLFNTTQFLSPEFPDLQITGVKETVLQNYLSVLTLLLP